MEKCIPRVPGPLRVQIVESGGTPVKFVGTTGPRVPCVVVESGPALQGRIVGPTDPGIRLEGTYGYFNKVLATGPLVYFPQWEAAGVVSDELVNGWDGAYTGVTLGQPGIGDGNTCPWFDGLNDFDNIWTAALAAAFNGAEGTVAIWARVNDVGVWTDGVFRRILHLNADANNRLDVGRIPANNTIRFHYMAGGVFQLVNPIGLTTTDWMHLAMTWSASTPPTGEMRAYYNGAQTGATQVGLGVWAGAIALAVMGANDLVPTSVWHGWLAHGAIWTRALAPGEIADLAVI